MHGYGVKQDYRKGEYWLKKSVEQDKKNEEGKIAVNEKEKNKKQRYKKNKKLSDKFNRLYNKLSEKISKQLSEEFIQLYNKLSENISEKLSGKFNQLYNKSIEKIEINKNYNTLYEKIKNLDKDIVINQLRKKENKFKELKEKVNKVTGGYPIDNHILMMQKNSQNINKEIEEECPICFGENGLHESYCEYNCKNN